MFRKNRGLFLLTAALLLISLALAGCGYEPDISAPERVEIERSTDWRGALLYIADESGPNADWGSIRIFDNVSGLVEKTVGQLQAAAPSDMYVTPEGSSMYVASSANGLIDKFRWDGNSWIGSGVTVETPASSLLALKAGPDGRLYAVDGSPGAAGRILILDPATDSLAAESITIPSLDSASGIAWSADGSKAYVAGMAAGSSGPVLLIASWPTAQISGSINLPLAQAHQVMSAPDGRFVYVMGRGEVLKVDPAAGVVAGSIKPAPGTEIDYLDADFSADGRYLFVTGTPPGASSNLYVIDLQTGIVINTVQRISSKANGIQRVE